MSKSPISPMRTVAAEQLLAQADELLRTIPTEEQLANDDAAAMWRGQATAVVSAWSLAKGSIELKQIWNQYDNDVWQFEKGANLRRLRALLHEMRHSLLMETGGSASVAVGSGNPFHYFDELTKNIKLATQDVFFIDPYLDAEFAGRYLPQVDHAASVRLLGSKTVPSLLPAVDLFTKQSGIRVEVREASFHDRFLFLDRKIGFQSGASFKDGAKKAPTALMEIVDVLPAMLQQYETLWTAAKVHR